jgi:hypothetical protein
MPTTTDIATLRRELLALLADLDADSEEIRLKVLEIISEIEERARVAADDIHETNKNRVEQQIALCDDVLERLKELDGNGALADLIVDVRMLRVSLLHSVASMDGDGDGSQPST